MMMQVTVVIQLLSLSVDATLKVVTMICCLHTWSNISGQMNLPQNVWEVGWTRPGLTKVILFRANQPDDYLFSECFLSSKVHRLSIEKERLIWDPVN